MRGNRAHRGGVRISHEGLAGTLRLSGTGAGNVNLTATQGSRQASAPFSIDFTGPGSMVFEPFQAAPQSVTMTLCAP